MTASSGTGGRSKNLILAAMIFAVAMTFIDQTIVSIAVPEIQKELGLTSTGQKITDRALGWLRTRIKQAAPQALIAAP